MPTPRLVNSAVTENVTAAPRHKDRTEHAHINDQRQFPFPTLSISRLPLSWEVYCAAERAFDIQSTSTPQICLRFVSVLIFFVQPASRSAA